MQHYIKKKLNMNNNLIQIARNILLEATGDSDKIPAKHCNPDTMFFDKKIYKWKGADSAFCFIGNYPKSVLTYMLNSESGEDAVHDNIFDAIGSAYENLEKKTLKEIEKDFEYEGIHIAPDISRATILYAATYQNIGGNHSILKARTKTHSGRLWVDIKSATLGKMVSVAVFYNKERNIKEYHLEALKEEFKLKSFLWCGSDSVDFNEYGDAVKELGGKNTQELHSDKYPDWTHEQLQELIVKMHTDSTSLSPIERKVLASIGITKMSSKTLPPEYNDKSRTSESVEA